MKVKEFNIHTGIYFFQTDSILTTMHSHPAIEYIIAEHGYFDLHTQHHFYKELRAAIIPANIPHSICAMQGMQHILMLEHRNIFLNNFLRVYGITLNDAVYTEQAADSPLLIVQKELYAASSANYLPAQDYDPCIARIIEYIEHNSTDYHTILATLCSLLNLSSSRISHLFRENTGITLKKYIVWNRLRTTIAHYLNHDTDLFSSLIEAGFYDQAHFAHSFRKMLGINPTAVYNSRIVQV